MSDSKIVELWNEMKVLVESVDTDVLKNVAGNTSAGVRARRGLKPLRKKIGELMKLMIVAEKARREVAKAGE